MKSQDNFEENSHTEQHDDILDTLDKEISSFGNMLHNLGNNLDNNTESINKLLNFIMNK